MKKLKKRLLHLWRKATGRYMLLEHPERENCNLTIVDPDAKDIVQAYGIPEERYKEIGSLLLEYERNNNTDRSDWVKRLQHAASLCKHPNELAIVCFTLGRGYEFEAQGAQMVKMILGGSHGPQI